MPHAKNRLELRLWEWFSRVRAFIARREPRLASVTADWCDEVALGFRRRSDRRRAFMHVGHRRRGGGHVICVRPGAEVLTVSHIVGLLLHEFGHVAKGASDTAADGWVFETFGIVVNYMGDRALEWVSPAAIKAAGI